MPSSRQVFRMPLSMPRAISEYSICRSAIGCTRVRAANGVGADLRQSDMLDRSPAFTMSAMAPTVSSIGTDRIEPRRPIDVDCLDAEPLQRVGEKILHRGGAAVHSRRTPIAGSRSAAELDADLQIVAIAPGERLADQHLIVAHAVEIAGVEQGDAGVERGVDGGDALAAVGRAVEIRHAHAAEADGRDGWTGGAEFALVPWWFSS